MIKNKLKYCFLFVLVALGFSSCLKDTAFLDVSNTQPIAEFSFGSDGTTSSSWGTLPLTEVDTFIAVDIASPQVLNYDVAITLKFDTTLITKFNAANPTNILNRLPDSCFSAPTSPFTIKIAAGYRIGKFPIKLYPNKINPKISYAMPFSIISATGTGGNLLLGTNSSSLIYGFIGNPIAGVYNVTGTRYNYTGVVSWNNVLPVPAGYIGTTDMSTISPRIASPDDPNTIEMPFGNIGTGYNYVITYVPASNTISVTYSAGILAYSNIVTTVVNFHLGTSTTDKTTFRILTHYNNAAASAGNDRIFDETFVHQ